MEIEMNKNRKKITAHSFFYSLCIWASIFMPVFQLTYNNMDELGVQYIDGAIISIFAWLVIFSLISFFSFLLPSKNTLKTIACFSYAALLSSLLNTFFLLTPQAVADGTDSIELITDKKSTIVFLVAFISITAIAFTRKGKLWGTFNSNMSFIAKLVITMSMFMALYTLISIPERSSGIINTLTEKDKNPIILGKKNVILISLDQVQGSVFEGYLNSEKGENLTKKLDGFTFYPNTLSTYPNTGHSITSTFLGRIISSSEKTIRAAYNLPESFPALAAERGLENKIYLQSKQLATKGRYSTTIQYPALLYTYALNNAFGLNISNILQKERAVPAKLIWKEDSNVFMNLSEKISINRNKPGTLLFIHFYFSHQPFIIDGKCTPYRSDLIDTKQTIEGATDTLDCASIGISNLIGHLKEIDAYENSEIFFISDHGLESNLNNMHNKNRHPSFFHRSSTYKTPAGLKTLGAYNPFILHKKINSHGNMLVRNEIVSLIDIAPTICHALQCEPKTWEGHPLGEPSTSQRKHNFWIYSGLPIPKIYASDNKEDWNIVTATSLEDLESKLENSFSKKIDVTWKEAGKLQKNDESTLSQEEKEAGTPDNKIYFSYGEPLFLPQGAYQAGIKYHTKNNKNHDNEFYWGAFQLHTESEVFKERLPQANNSNWKHHIFHIDRPLPSVEIRSFLEHPEAINIEAVAIKEIEATPICNNIIIFNEKSHIEYYKTKTLSTVGKAGRWSIGTRNSIYFKTEKKCHAKAVKFKLHAFVPPQNPQQKARVFINDQAAGEIQITRNESRPKEFIFKLPASADNEYTVEFAIENPVSPKSLGISADPRELGLKFVSMELVTEEGTP